MYLCTLDQGEEKQMDFDRDCLLCKFRLSSFVTKSKERSSSEDIP